MDAATSPAARAFGFTPLAIADGVVYLPGADGQLHAYDSRSGSRRGSAGARRAPVADNRVAPLPPAVVNQVMYLGSGDVRLYAYPVPARL